MTETITFINNKTDGTWRPAAGELVTALLDDSKLDSGEKTRLLEESTTILKQCGNPAKETNDTTGLVVGYVQSGKTLSFTSVIALAAENGFNLIITIAGTTNFLVDQTENRLKKDLRINESDQAKIDWKCFRNPTSNQASHVTKAMKPGIMNPNPVLLVTVMKNKSHLSNLITVFKKCGENLKEIRALIIDDEADQASLNTRPEELTDVSTIYGLIRKLKSVIPHHTYLQYTATPQAPLFINILDVLSPQFVKVLTPGHGYTGGKTFFDPSNQWLVKSIPDDEVYDKKDNRITEIPDTLIEALQFYYLTVHLGALNKKISAKNRTMMIHASQLTGIHKIFTRWVELQSREWSTVLKLPANDPCRIDLMDSFETVFSTINQNPGNVISFNELEPHDLADIIDGTGIYECNSSGKSATIDFKQDYSAILIGGQLLDRGFTIEGLNVTYMPRSIGVGNADTIQQRCRFFGYKKSYINLCRVYLTDRAIDAYLDYVEHEEDIRNKLNEFNRKKKSDQTLSDLKRLFILQPYLQPTRRNVILDPTYRIKWKEWQQTDMLDPNQTTINKTYKKLIESIRFKVNPNDEKSTAIQRHSYCEIAIDSLLIDFLPRLQYNDPKNSQIVTHLAYTLSYLQKKGSNTKIHLINMSNGLSRERSVDDSQRIKNLYQGANPATAYDGDKSQRSKNAITIQFHHMEIKNRELRPVTAMGIYIPEKFALAFIGQNPGKWRAY